MKTLLIFFLLTFNAYAVPSVRINIARGVAPISATKAEAHMIFKAAVKQIRRELGVRIIANRWRDVKQENYDFYKTTPLDIYDEIRLDAQEAYPNNLRPNFIISVPAISNEHRFIYGATDGYPCIHYNWKNSGAAIIRQPEYPGHEYAKSITAVAHELALIIGARERPEVQNIMNAEALFFLADQDWQEHFSLTNKEEVKRCLREYEKNL